MRGLWKQHELSDGTYDMDDLVLVNRVLDIEDENKRRAHAAAQKERVRERS